MAEVTVCSDFGAQENKICHSFHFFPFYLWWSDGTDAMVLMFLNVEFQDSFFIFPLFLSSRASSVPLHFWPLLWYHLHIWGCWYFSQWSWLLLVIHSAHMMYSAHKLNKQGDNIQPCHTPFPILNQFIVPCSVLIVASWPTYRFLRTLVRWSGIPVSLRIFHSFFVSYTVKGFSVDNEAEVNIFLELPCFVYDPVDVGNLITNSSAFSKLNL